MLATTNKLNNKLNFFITLLLTLHGFG
jgi:hypothetical protein